MIEYLSGKVQYKRLSSIILDVRGVGYGVELPLTHLKKIGETGSDLSLWIFTRVKEDNLSLYGFLDEADRLVFQILIACSGVGPRVALALLSTMTVSELRQVVLNKKTERFEEVPGIGKRTAEKIQLELYGKLDKFPQLGLSDTDDFPLESSLNKRAAEEGKLPESFKQDLVSALSNLGLKDKDIKSLVAQVADSYDGEDFSTLTKKALALLSSTGQKDQKKPDETSKAVDLNTLF